MAQYQDMREMSMELNSAFDNSMYSECARQLKYKTDPLCEVLNNDYSKIVGSAAEGTSFSDSDVDVLFINQTGTGIKVCYNPQEACTYSDKPHLRLTRGPLTPAGYTKLQVYLNGNNCENIEHTLLQSCFMYEIDRYNSNTIFLTNRKVIDKFPAFNATDHGPAQTIQFNNDQTFDKVVAYESKIIPIDMSNWFERTRLESWPSKTTCELFKSMGCFYVGVGRSKSPEQELEWRISPTRQELYLMLNLNPTQFRCYILLKLFKNFIREYCGEGINSYHCKTALFWTIENTKNSIWQPHNLIECVLKCLILLLDWVTETKCPNYFIPEENMFTTKVMNEIQLKTLQYSIKNYAPICSQLFSPVIRKNYTKVFAILKSSFILKVSLSEPTYGASFVNEHAFQIFQQYIELTKTKPRNACFQEFQDMASPHKIDKDILLEMLEEKLCCLNRKIHLKSLLERNTFTELDITAHLNDPLKKSHIDQEYFLKLASIASTRGANSTCDVLLQNLRRMTTLDIYCVCLISFYRDITDHAVQSNISKLISVSKQFINKLSISDILKRFSFCLQFYDSEYEAGIVMSPCHFEAHKTIGIPLEMISITMMYLKYDLVSVHPTVYRYFLQYKNSEMMAKKGDICVALGKLEDLNLVSLQEGIMTHPDTTLNILGHIYTTKGWDRLAVNCFRRSLLMQQYYNAVKWHVIFMLFCNLSIPEKLY